MTGQTRMELRDKVALITGAASGIGRATAQLFAREGAQVVCTDIDDARGRETVELIRSEGFAASYHHADVTDAEELAAVAERCATEVGKLDILFNNAGRTARQTFEATTAQTWKEMLDLHLTGVFLCSQAFLAMMKKAGSGSIINHASVDSLFGNPSIAAYSAAKGGLIPLTHVMAHDLAKYQIRVNSISSGGIFTAMSLGKEKVTASRVAVTPLKRMGTPEEVASVALFFASPASSFVNGANLVVDGGRTAITQGCFDA
jgi:NAD(P)-dependent dehydrogenase (short-subunit alcohol dehydrogenase family)